MLTFLRSAFEVPSKRTSMSLRALASSGGVLGFLENKNDMVFSCTGKTSKGLGSFCAALVRVV